MGVKRIEVVECDECGLQVDTGSERSWVDASVYGVAFHGDCWRNIGGPRVARVLGLDEIHYRGGGLDGHRAMERRQT